MPESVHTKTRRIAKNTVLLYMRSLISLVISLYTSRLVLKGLGVDDYGVYGVVGGFVSMFSIVSSSLRGAISRFMNFSMGTGDKEEMRNTFALSLNIMVILAVIVVILTETFGLWFLYNRMNIPAGRETAAFWCFQFSVLSTISNFLVISFTASIVAHEKLGTFAYIDVGEVVLKFLVALLITFSLGDVDKLVLYAALLLVITLSKQMYSRVYAMKHFEECRIRWYWEKRKFIEMFTYAGWGFVGTTSETFAGQGVNMVVNVVYGTAVNAARSLSWTVIHAVQIFVNNFTMAIWPQVAQSYASGDHGYMKELIFRGSKFSFYIMWMIFLPLILETEFVVGLWLGEYPDHTINFIRLALISNIISTFHIVLGMGIKACGKIRGMQIATSLMGFLMFIASYLLLHQGLAPEWTYIISIIITVITVLIMLWLSRKQLAVSAKEYIRSVIIPSCIVFAVSCIIPTIMRYLMPFGWIRFIAVLLVSIGISGICILYLGCSPSERNMLVEMVLGKLRRIRH